VVHNQRGAPELGKAEFTVDLMERATATFFQALGGLATVSQWTHMGPVMIGSTATFISSLSVLKGILARFLGDRASAAFLPLRLLTRA
jgi:hypothetical protein